MVYLDRISFLFHQSNNNSSAGCAYIVESIDLWHGRLGHVNMASIRKLRNMHLINVSDKNNCSKCSICVEAKYTKKPFKSIMNRTTELLEMIF